MNIKFELDKDMKDLLMDTVKTIRDYYKMLTMWEEIDHEVCTCEKAVDCDAPDADDTLDAPEEEKFLWRDAQHSNATKGAWICETEPMLTTDGKRVKICADFTIMNAGVSGSTGGILFLTMMPLKYTPSDMRSVEALVTRGDTKYKVYVSIQDNELIFLNCPDGKGLMKGDKVHIDGEYTLN